MAGLCAVLACLAAAPPASGQESSGLLLRNRAPLIGLVGVPAPGPAPRAGRAEFVAQVFNIALAQQAGAEALLFDGETRVLTARLARMLGSRVTVAAEIPWISHGGGFLDPVIDAFHDLTGLREGVRPDLPRNDLRFVYVPDGVPTLNRQRSTSGLGDVALGIAVDAARFGPATLVARLDAELPTGDPERLTGNGGLDLAAGLGLRMGSGDGDLQGWLGAGVAWPGGFDLDGVTARPQVAYYNAALRWRALDSLDLLLGLAGQTAAFESGLKLIGGPSLQFGAGAHWQFGRRLGLRLGFTQDIRAETAPDFGLELALISSTR